MHACALILEDCRTIYLSLDQSEQLTTREKTFGVDAEVIKKLLNYKKLLFSFYAFSPEMEELISQIHMMTCQRC
ncbi:hypothetical protein [Candidatus Protochlamydia sp. W-9]|uniref:hypothetical protein n=1 Tax=Candidatus Protochlamydia sp. W-9 TaxID=1785087 RepID=UPI00096A7267|nr:hypothetical protein [Candidatus Protochlamydia sp. W-9]